MSLRGGRRLTTNLRPPTSTPDDYVPVTAGGFVTWISSLASGSGMTPTFIASGETFTVPTNRQAFYAMIIDNEGILDVDGFLIGVD